jgi:hypothetical protein
LYKSFSLKDRSIRDPIFRDPNLKEHHEAFLRNSSSNPRRIWWTAVVPSLGRAGYRPVSTNRIPVLLLPGVNHTEDLVGFGELTDDGKLIITVEHDRGYSRTLSESRVYSTRRLPNEKYMMKWLQRFQRSKEERVLKAIRNNVRFTLEISKEARIGISSLYPILARLENDGVIDSAWGWDDNIKRRVYYIKEENHE